MIKQEEVYNLSGRILLHTYSDTNYIIQIETSTEYEEAYDTVPCRFTYIESDKKLPTIEEVGEDDTDKDKIIEIQEN